MRSIRGLLTITSLFVLASLSCTLSGFQQTRKITEESLTATSQPHEPLTPLQSPTPNVGLSYPQDGCPQNDGKIVYAYDDPALETLTDLWMMDGDGANQHPIGAALPGRQSEPAWSPERCRIAYVSFTNAGDDDIYLTNDLGEQTVQLTTDPARDMMPDWSPDGSRIAFVSYRADGIQNIWVMNADGTDQHQITFNGLEHSQWMQWSPTGEWIAYIYNAKTEPNVGGRIHLVSPDGNQDHQLTPDAGPLGDFDLAWSQNGKTLYFLSNRSSMVEVWSINVDGSDIHQITTLPSGFSASHSLRLSPDGSKLAYYGVSPGVEKFGQEIYVLNTDGSDVHSITLSPGDEEWLDW